MSEKPTPCECSEEFVLGVEYRLTTEDYDGISEWRCTKCGKRWGRWTGKELKDGELEKSAARFER